MRFLSLIAAAAAVLCSACVTSGDLHEVAMSLERVEAVVNDPLSTGEDLKDVLRVERERVKEVAAEVEDRTAGEIDSLKEVGGVAGVTSILAGLAFNLYRDHKRKTRNEPTKPYEAPKTA